MLTRLANDDQALGKIEQYFLGVSNDISRGNSVQIDCTSQC